MCYSSVAQDFENKHEQHLKRARGRETLKDSSVAGTKWKLYSSCTSKSKFVWPALFDGKRLDCRNELTILSP